MSFIEPKEFAEKYGIKYATLRAHISRGKVLKKGGLIDTTNPINAFYITDNKLKIIEVKQDKKSSSKVVSMDNNITLPVYTKEQSQMKSLVIRERKAKMVKAEKDAELLEIKIQKAVGKLIPIDVIQNLFIVNVQSIFVALENELENLASIYVEKLGGDREDLAEIMKKVRIRLNNSITISKKNAAKECKNIMKNYSESKFIGSRN